MKATKSTTVRPESSREIEFYEVMQASVPTAFGTDTFDDSSAGEDEGGTPVGRTTAIFTLVTLAVVVALLSFIVVEGLRAALR